MTPKQREKRPDETGGRLNGMIKADRERLDKMTAKDRERLQDECLLLEVESLRREVLSKKITWSNTDMPTVLGIGPSTWEELKAAGEAPPGVLIGGREFWLPSRVMQWLENRLQTKVAAAAGGDNSEESTDAKPPPRSSPSILPEFGRPPLNAAGARHTAR